MNDFSKMLWAAALLIVGYVGASWFGPPQRPNAADSATPAGWSNHRLTPVDESPTLGIAPTQALVATSSGPSQPPFLGLEAPDLVVDSTTAAGGNAFVPTLRRQPEPLAAETATAKPLSQPARAATADNAWWLAPAIADPQTNAMAVSEPNAWTPPSSSIPSLAAAGSDETWASTHNATVDRSSSDRTTGGWRSNSGVVPPALLAPQAAATPLASRGTELSGQPPQMQPGHVPELSPLPGPNPPGAAFNSPSQLARGEFEANRQTHFVADGDTLARLAQRYLGSADRSEEIFAANRHVLENPRLLPIGVELTIPTSPPQSGNVAFTNGPPRAHLQGPVSTHTGYRGQP